MKLYNAYERYFEMFKENVPAYVLDTVKNESELIDKIQKAINKSEPFQPPVFPEHGKMTSIDDSVRT